MSNIETIQDLDTLATQIENANQNVFVDTHYDSEGDSKLSGGTNAGDDMEFYIIYDSNGNFSGGVFDNHTNGKSETIGSFEHLVQLLSN